MSQRLHDIHSVQNIRDLVHFLSKGFLICFSVDETTPTRGVLLVVKGVMNIFWREIVNGGNVDFAEIEDYLDEKIKVG